VEGPVPVLPIAAAAPPVPDVLVPIAPLAIESAAAAELDPFDAVDVPDPEISVFSRGRLVASRSKTGYDNFNRPAKRRQTA
jgi:hypothetical protein